MTRRVVASIEARMGSSRFPGKVLADVCGRPALSRLVARLRMCRHLDDIVLATTVSPKDDPLATWAVTEGVAIFRGSEEDVLGRVCGAHAQAQSEIIVEVTGDCTLMDPQVLDMGIRHYLENDCDVVTNCVKLTYPQGVDIQVFARKPLDQVAATITEPAVREHVSLYFYEHPEIYRTIHLFAPARWHAPDQRFQLDYEEDLAFIREVYRRLEPIHGEGFGVEEILSLLASDPAVAEINRHCTNKPVR